MEAQRPQRHEEANAGFTLIELLVVLLIIGIREIVKTCGSIS
jgi:prepilin-type N-terminal cleavage/methylation domain-containing protein